MEMSASELLSYQHFSANIIIAFRQLGVRCMDCSKDYEEGKSEAVTFLQERPLLKFQKYSHDGY